MTKTTEASSIAATLAAQTAAKAADLASLAATTATALATKTAETTAVMSNDITWMKQSLSGIEQTLKEINGTFVTNERFAEVEKNVMDHEDRIRNVEHNTWIWAGGLAVLTILVPLVIKFFVK
jgi:hypothetical protein